MTDCVQDFGQYFLVHVDAAYVGSAVGRMQVMRSGRTLIAANFAKAHAAGRRISAAHVGSVMKHLINHRTGEKQQMRWSPPGAHHLLELRVEILNGSLLSRHRGWRERYRRSSRYSAMFIGRLTVPHA
jgi:hypothetical protein